MTDVDRAATARAFDLVALDLDGTLLDKSGELAEGVQDAVQAALEQGLVVSIVSGRGRLPLLPYLSELGLTAPYVASGGAYIAYPTNGRVIRRMEFAWEEVVALADLVAPSHDQGGAAWALLHVLQRTAAELLKEARARALWAPVAAPSETSQQRE